MRKKSELLFNAVLPIVDFVSIVSAFVLAYIIRVKIDNRPVPNPIRALLFFKVFLVLLPVWIFILRYLGSIVCPTPAVAGRSGARFLLVSRVVPCS
ncbi:MAG TPA: hypothetical protein VLE72_03315 [Candidatus Saccharimonadales bacterium]|nr:hypothetical protein [Candidatus Saccharimonadales bacterium]